MGRAAPLHAKLTIYTECLMSQGQKLGTTFFRRLSSTSVVGYFPVRVLLLHLAAEVAASLFRPSGCPPGSSASCTTACGTAAHLALQLVARLGGQCSFANFSFLLFLERSLLRML